MRLQPSLAYIWKVHPWLRFTGMRVQKSLATYDAARTHIHQLLIVSTWWQRHRRPEIMFEYLLVHRSRKYNCFTIPHDRNSP